MRADRLLSMIWLLRAHGRLSASELAQRLEGNALERGALVRCLEGVRAGDYIHGMENEVLIEDVTTARTTDAA